MVKYIVVAYSLIERELYTSNLLDTGYILIICFFLMTTIELSCTCDVTIHYTGQSNVMMFVKF